MRECVLFYVQSSRLTLEIFNFAMLYIVLTSIVGLPIDEQHKCRAKTHRGVILSPRKRTDG